MRGPIVDNHPKIEVIPLEPVPKGLVDLVKRIEGSHEVQNNLAEVPVLHVLLPQSEASPWMEAPIRAIPTQRHKQWIPSVTKPEFIDPNETLDTLFSGAGGKVEGHETLRSRKLDTFISDYVPYQRSRRRTGKSDSGSESDKVSIEAWEAQWPRTKTKSCLSSDASSTRIERDLRATKKKDVKEETENANDILNYDEYLFGEEVTDKWDFYKRVLSLPLPDFPGDKLLYDEEVATERELAILAEDAHATSKKAARFSVISMMSDSLDAETPAEPLSPTKRFSGEYPTPERYNNTDIHANMPTSRLNIVYEAFRYVTLDTSMLLWELSSLSRLDASASVFFDKMAAPKWIKSGGCDAAIHLIIASFHPPVHPTPGYLKVDEDIPVHQRIHVPGNALVSLYRIVLLMNHCGQVLGDDHTNMWEEEFKYLLSNKVVMRALDSDSRPIARVIQKWIENGVSRVDVPKNVYI
jgi:hypothetical protein